MNETKLTREQRQERVKQLRENLSCIDIMTTYGHFPIYRNGTTLIYKCPWREDKNASLSLTKDGHVWKDHGRMKGEDNAFGNSIDLIIALEGLNPKIRKEDFVIAIEKAMSLNIIHVDIPECVKSNNVRNTPSVVNILSVKPIEENIALMRYLVEKRGIDEEVAKDNVKAVYYTLGRKRKHIDRQGNESEKLITYFAVGFRLNGGENSYALRNDYFKNCNAQNISIIENDNKKGVCAIFEGFIDYLSFLTMKKRVAGYELPNFVILNSITNIDKALEYLSTQKTLHCCLDNDAPGEKTFNYLKSMLLDSENSSSEIQIFNQSSVIFKDYKDVNEYLLGQRDRFNDHYREQFRQLCEDLLMKNGLKVDGRFSSWEEYKQVHAVPREGFREGFCRYLNKAALILNENGLTPDGKYPDWQSYAASHGVINNYAPTVRSYTSSYPTSHSDKLFGDEKDEYIPKALEGVSLTDFQRISIAENRRFRLRVPQVNGGVISRNILLTANSLREQWIDKKREDERKIFGDERDDYIPVSYLGVPLSKEQRFLIAENKPISLEVPLSDGSTIQKSMKISLDKLRDKWEQAKAELRSDENVKQKILESIQKRKEKKIEQSNTRKKKSPKTPKLL